MTVIINGTTGITTPADTVAGGNLTFTGTGNRITGDFVNATIANRVMFQTSAANTSTVVNAVPNGTGITSRFVAWDNNGLTNGAYGDIGIYSNAEVQIRSGIIGTGTYLPITFSTGGSERMRIDTSGNVGIGTSSIGGRFDVLGADDTAMYFKNASANIRFRPYVTSYTTSQISALNPAGNAYTPLAIGGSYTVIETGGTERMRIDSSGNLLVGTTSAAYSAKTEVVFVSGRGIAIRRSATDTAGMLALVNGNGLVGEIITSGATTTYATSSDYRLKENIQPMQNALAKVAELNPVTYNWKADSSAGQGFIAHELQAVVPDCVTGEKDAVDAEGKPVYQGIDTSFLVATLCKAIQELEARVKQLEAK